MLQAPGHYSQAMGPTETLGIGRTTEAFPAAKTVGPAKVHHLAKQFEAMFMTEMLHQAHSKSHAVGKFRAGDGERAMQPFLDQALGDAVASRGGTGLAKTIEQSLNALQTASKGK
jgi:peptidoglycan hydrolase FlgJ